MLRLDESHETINAVLEALECEVSGFALPLDSGYLDSFCPKDISASCSPSGLSVNAVVAVSQKRFFLLEHRAGDVINQLESMRAKDN